MTKKGQQIVNYPMSPKTLAHRASIPNICQECKKSQAPRNYCLKAWALHRDGGTLTKCTYQDRIKASL